MVKLKSVDILQFINESFSQCQGYREHLNKLKFN
jgi:hypothetical protein